MIMQLRIAMTALTLVVVAAPVQATVTFNVNRDIFLRWHADRHIHHRRCADNSAIDQLGRIRRVARYSL